LKDLKSREKDGVARLVIANECDWSEFKRAMDGLERSPDRRTHLPHARFTIT